MIAVALIVSLAAQAMPPAPALTLAEAERRAEARSPVLAAGLTNATAAEARVDESRAALLPQVVLSATYKYGTANRPFRIGLQPFPPAPNVTAQSPTRLYDYLTATLTASQLLYDFGQTTEAWRSARLAAASASIDAKTIRLNVLLDVRLAFFNVVARRELVRVAREDLDNQNHHLAQVSEMIQVKVRPTIDLFQAKANVGTSQLRLIGAENDYLIAKADLDRAMGNTSSAPYDVAAEEYPPVRGEADDLAALDSEAFTARPDLASANLQIGAGEREVAAVRGTYFPALHLVLTGSDAGPLFDPYPITSYNLRWNYSAGVVLTWPIFEGLRTRGRMREARALVGVAQANRDLIGVTVRMELERAQRTVGAAKTAVAVAAMTVDNARERMRLAEERYKVGAGTALEVSDAQLAYTSASAGQVEMRYQLAAARAQLLHALGRND